MVNININFILKSTSIVFSSGKVYCNSIFSKKSIKFFNSTAILSEKFYKMDNRSSLLSFTITSYSNFSDFIYRLSWKRLKVLAKKLGIKLKTNPSSEYIVGRIVDIILVKPLSELPSIKEFLLEHRFINLKALNEHGWNSMCLIEILKNDNFTLKFGKDWAWRLNISLVENNDDKWQKLKILDKERVTHVDSSFAESTPFKFGHKEYQSWRQQLHNQILIEWAIQVCQLEVVYK